MFIPPFLLHIHCIVIFRETNMNYSTVQHIFRYRNLIFPCQACVRHNSNRVSCAKVDRKYYERLYPTLLVFPNGSTINIRNPQPRQIIQVNIYIYIYMYIFFFLGGGGNVMVKLVQIPVPDSGSV